MERLRFEPLLAELSAGFVNLPADQVDSQIEAALRRLVEFLDVDRGGLAEMLPDPKQLVLRPGARSGTSLTEKMCRSAPGNSEEFRASVSALSRPGVPRPTRRGANGTLLILGVVPTKIRLRKGVGTPVLT